MARGLGYNEDGSKFSEIVWENGKEISEKILTRREVDQPGCVLVAHVLDG